MIAITHVTRSGKIYETDRSAAHLWLAAIITLATGITVLVWNHYLIWTRYDTDEGLDHFFRASAATQSFVRIWLIFMLVSSVAAVTVRYRPLRAAAACLALIATIGLAYNVILGLSTM